MREKRIEKVFLEKNGEYATRICEGPAGHNLMLIKKNGVVGRLPDRGDVAQRSSVLPSQPKLKIISPGREIPGFPKPGRTCIQLRTRCLPPGYFLTPVIDPGHIHKHYYYSRPRSITREVTVP